MEVDLDSETLQEIPKMSLRPRSPHGFKIFNNLRKKKLLCDAVLRLEDGGDFPVHRVILSTCSPYFRTLFTTTLHSKEKTDILLGGLNSKTMNLILDYCYTRKVDINQENVLELLASADYLFLPELLELCCDFLRSILAPENCIGIMRFARYYNCPSLEEAARCFVMLNFVQILYQSDQLPELAPEELQAIIRSNELNVGFEELVWEAVVRWIDHDAENRKHHILELMKGVRLGLLDTQFLVDYVAKHPYVVENKKCRPILLDTLRHVYFNDTEILTHDFDRPRNPYEILFVVGGISRRRLTNSIETYDPRANRWVKIRDAVLMGSRVHHGTVVIGFNIYVIGGSDGRRCLNSCLCFNAVSKTWREVSPMLVCRCYVSTAALGELVYALGGYDGLRRQKKAERYDHQKNQWTPIAPMNIRRSDASATTLNGNIYIIGGYNGEEWLNSAEVYNPELNQWTLIPDMNIRRSGVSCVAYHGHVYAIGGFDGISRMRSVERYSPTTETWTTVPDMQHQRSNFRAEVIEDYIFVMGGFDGSTAINSVECYDGTSNKWFKVTAMNMCRSGMSSCIIMGLPNVCDYTRIDY
jgi:kelch-like protein 10